MMEFSKDNKESPMSTTDYRPVIDFDDPSARLALLGKVGIPEYNRLNLEAVSSDKSKKDRQMTYEEASVSTAQIFEKEELNRGHRSNPFSQVRNQKIRLFLEQYGARRAAEDKTRHCFVGDPDRTAIEHTPGTALGGHNYTVYELDGQYLAEHVTVGACSIIGRTLALVDKSFLDKCLALGQGF